MPDRFSQEFERLRPKIWKRWLSRHNDPPETLYHYTSAEGFAGIVESQRPWATEFSYLNDTAELEYGCELVSEVLAAKRRGQHSKVVARFLEDAEFVFSPYEVFYSLFVFSLCAEGDLRSQWCLYAADATGYAIGFGAGALLRHPLSGTPDGQRLLKVEYRRDEQVVMVSELIDSVTDHLSTTTDGMTEIEAHDLITDACIVLRELMTDYLACFKEWGWREEQEWRVVYRCDASLEPERIKHRPSNGPHVPYVELDCTSLVPPWWGRLPIREVMIGPGADPSSAEDAARSLLSLKLYSDCRIAQSRLTLRR
jgi:hypothetical protein